MKIDGLTPPSRNQRTDDAKSRRKTSAAKPSDTSSADSTVELTGISSQLQAIEALIGDYDGVDMNKVESIRQAISEDRYSVNEELIAERLVASIVEGLRHGTKK